MKQDKIIINKKQKQEISYCLGCHCMTKSIPRGYGRDYGYDGFRCGKCGAKKTGMVKKMDQLDFTIMRLDEFMLCNKHQDVITSMDDTLIILDIVCDEVEKFKDDEKKND